MLRKFWYVLSLSPRKFANLIHNKEQIDSELIGSLTRDDLTGLLNILKDEMALRTFQIYQMIPGFFLHFFCFVQIMPITALNFLDEVWEKVFRMVNNNMAVENAFTLRLVCSRWSTTFPQSITTCTINSNTELERLYIFSF